ncbi:MAG: hypothetical protein ABI823_08875 [Bryobacteraceae bacterium]
MTPAEVRMIECAESIKGILDEYRGGEANQRAIGEARPSIEEIDKLSPNGYMHERTHSLMTWIEIFYSAQKHLNYGGAKRVRMHILDDITKIQAFVRTGRAKEAT